MFTRLHFIHTDFCLHLNLKVSKNKLLYGTNINLLNVSRHCKSVQINRSRPSHDRHRHNRPVIIAWFALDMTSPLWQTTPLPVMSTPVMIVMTSTSYGCGSHNRGGHCWGGKQPHRLSEINKMFAFHYYIIKFEISSCSLSHCKLSGQTGHSRSSSAEDCNGVGTVETQLNSSKHINPKVTILS